MVRIFSMYHFKGQLVDSIDDLSSLTVTNNNKLLIAQADYTVEVKDLLSDKKSPIFIFPTVDKVQWITHCASGNYVATLEGKQTFQKSDVLTVRVYTNWELDSAVNEAKKSTGLAKRLVRARIAGVVTPSSTKPEVDYLDMIEIPISFTSPTFLTCCQKTGKLLVTCGPTMHLFRQVYTRSHNGKSPVFMDFVPFAEVFQVDFLPTAVVICENVISAYSSNEISVFILKKVTENSFKESSIDPEIASNAVENQHEKSKLRLVVYKIVVGNTLHINSVLKMVQENQENQLKTIIDSCSFPIMIPLQDINDVVVSSKEKRFPFRILEKRATRSYKNGKVRDNLVETLCDKDISVVAESLLALRMDDPEEPVTKIALQVLSRQKTDSEKDDSQDNEIYCVGSSRFMALNFLVTTYQEGYLFYASADNLEDGLQCVAIFSFSSQVTSVMYEGSFLHVLTQTGIETYNVPTLHSIILNEKPNLVKYSQYISIIGMHPFMGIVDFIGSKDLVTIFTSANDRKSGRESLPWTVYSLKVPSIFEVYQEMIENSNSFKVRDDETYKYLSLESFLIFQMALNLRLSVNHDREELIKDIHSANSMELAKIFFRSGGANDMKIGCAVILASDVDPMKFVETLQNEKSNIVDGIMYLLKKFIKRNKGSISDEKAEWLIQTFGENGEIKELSSFLLSNETICRILGRGAIQYLKKYVNSYREKSDVHVVYALCVLYTQECHQNDALEILKLVQENEQTYRNSFVEVVLKYWKFLFDEFLTSRQKQTCFSELSSIMIEHLSSEMAEILTKLVLEEKTFEMSDIVQMLLKQFPCHVSLQKGHFVLQSFLELIFSTQAVTNFKDSNVNNCLKILVRSYLTQLEVKESKEDLLDRRSYQPIFVDSLPEFVEYLPVVENISYPTLKKLQELVWNKMLNEKSVNEIIETLPNHKLKLNIMAMLNHYEFIKDLMKDDCVDAIFPYAKSSCNKVKTKWREILVLVQNKISDLKDSEQDYSKYEEIFKEILNYLAHNMSPTQLNTIIDSAISKTDEMYWKYIMKAQQISYADDVKELIVNTGQQLLYSSSVY